MTSGITNRPMAGTKVALAPTVLAALLGGTLLAGSILGAAVASEAAALGHAASVAGQILATGSSPQSQAFRRDAQMKLGRGAFVQDAPQGVATTLPRQVESLVRGAQLVVGRGPLAGSGSSDTIIGLLPVAMTPYLVATHADGHGFQR